MTCPKWKPGYRSVQPTHFLFIRSLPNQSLKSVARGGRVVFSSLENPLQVKSPYFLAFCIMHAFSRRLGCFLRERTPNASLSPAVGTLQWWEISNTIEIPNYRED